MDVHFRRTNRGQEGEASFGGGCNRVTTSGWRTTDRKDVGKVVVGAGENERKREKNAMIVVLVVAVMVLTEVVVVTVAVIVVVAIMGKTDMEKKGLGKESFANRN